MFWATLSSHVRWADGTWGLLRSPCPPAFWGFALPFWPQAITETEKVKVTASASVKGHTQAVQKSISLWNTRIQTEMREISLVLMFRALSSETYVNICVSELGLGYTMAISKIRNLRGGFYDWGRNFTRLLEKSKFRFGSKQKSNDNVKCSKNQSISIYHRRRHTKIHVLIVWSGMQEVNVYRRIDRVYGELRLVNSKEKNTTFSYHDIAIAETNFTQSWKFGSHMEDVKNFC